MILGGFEPLSLSDYPGTPAAVIFTQGCNWRCPYCHNKLLLPEQGEHQYSVEFILHRLEQRQNKLGGVVVSGGEPTLQEGLADFLSELKSLNFKVKLDTNGSRPAVLESLLSLDCLDYIAMDIKAPWHKYQLLTGATEVNVKAVQDSVQLIASSSIAHHFRTTCPEQLLSESDIEMVKRTLPHNVSHVIQKCKDYG